MRPRLLFNKIVFLVRDTFFSNKQRLFLKAKFFDPFWFFLGGDEEE